MYILLILLLLGVAELPKLLHLDNFRGFASNTDVGDLPPELGSKMENIRPKGAGGGMEGIPGYKLFANGPTDANTSSGVGIAGDMRYFKEVVINDTQVLIAWGLDGNSIQHFYFSTDGGTNWTEITEINFFEVLSATSAKVFRIVAGVGNTGNALVQWGDTPSSTDNKYKDFWCFVHDDSGGVSQFGYITAYTGSTKEITLKEDLSFTPASPDKVSIMRFPLWNLADLEDLADGTTNDTEAGAAFLDHRNFVRDAGNFKPTIVQRFNAVSIYTGRKKDNLNIGIDNHSNLWLGHVDTGILFNETALDFTGFHAERKLLDRPVTKNIIDTKSGVTPSDDPVTDNKIWGFMFSFIYDGYQESPIFDGKEDLFQRIEFILDPQQVLDLSAVTNRHIQLGLSWDRFATNTEMEFHNGSRRFQALRIYMAEAEKVTSTEFRRTTPFFFVKEIKMNIGWGGTGPYTQTVLIFGRDLEAGKKKEAELVLGYFSKVRVNADFGTEVNGREVAASLVIGEEDSVNEEKFEESKSQLIYSAINSALRNSQDGLPESEIKDMSENGIYEIFALKPLGTNLAVFGENKLSILRGTEEIDSFQEVGVNGYWSAASKGSVMNWGNLKSIYSLVIGGVPREIGFPIRNEWQALSTNNRKTSKAVFDKEDGLFVLHSASGTTYIYDEVLQTWRTYVADKAWEWLDVGVDGELLATDKTDIFELFPTSGSTENPTGTWEKEIDFERPVSVNAIQLMYKITGVITVKIFDVEKNTNYPIAETKYLARTEFEAEVKRLSFRAKKIKLQLTINPTAAANFNYEIDWLSLYGHPLSEAI